MAKVTFRVRNKGTVDSPKYDHYSVIYARYGNAVTNTGYKVEITQWSFTTNLLKNTYKPEELTTAQKIKGYKPLSKAVLKEIEALIEKLDNDMPRHIKRDSKWLKSVLAEFHGTPIEKKTEKIFSDFLNEHINSKGLYVAKGTYLKGEDKFKYQDHPIVKRFKEFDNGRNIMPNDLSNLIVEEFINKYKGDYLGSSLRLDLVAWRGALLIATEQGFPISNYKRWNLKLLQDKNKPDKIVLTPDEIEKLFNFDCKNDSLNNVRVLFIAMYTTAQRYSDFAANLERFKKCEDDYLWIRQIKTGTEVNVPITNMMREVFKQFDVRAVEVPFFDRTIKKVCKMAGIDEPMQGRLKRNKRKILLGHDEATAFKERDITLPKYEWIASHTARRSWASTFEYILGRTDAMKVTGHRVEATFASYTKKTTISHIEKLKQIGYI